jgi:hypothetical protein
MLKKDLSDAHIENFRNLKLLHCYLGILGCYVNIMEIGVVMVMDNLGQKSI